MEKPAGKKRKYYDLTWKPAPPAGKKRNAWNVSTGY
jgi:hypothetical protein